jgi:hypothetical protein
MVSKDRYNNTQSGVVCVCYKVGHCPDFVLEGLAKSTKILSVYELLHILCSETKTMRKRGKEERNNIRLRKSDNRKRSIKGSTGGKRKGKQGKKEEKHSK